MTTTYTSVYNQLNVGIDYCSCRSCTLLFTPSQLLGILIAGVGLTHHIQSSVGVNLYSHLSYILSYNFSTVGVDYCSYLSYTSLFTASQLLEGAAVVI